jgi:hypothetical protein
MGWSKYKRTADGYEMSWSGQDGIEFPVRLKVGDDATDLIPTDAAGEQQAVEKAVRERARKSGVPLVETDGQVVLSRSDFESVIGEGNK